MVWVGLPSQYINLPDHVTVAAQTTDGRHFTQGAYVGNGATDKWDSVAEKDFTDTPWYRLVPRVSRPTRRIDTRRPPS